MFLPLILGPLNRASAQTDSTGAVMGIALGPSGSALSGVLVRLVAADTHKVKSYLSDENGWFTFPN
jgi:uncharacterized membrane protein YeaQ/YmgE (transglycosylase-associated protein family)